MMSIPDNGFTLPGEALFGKTRKNGKNHMKTAFLTLAASLLALTAFAEPSIWLIGDSTVCNYGRDRYPQAGWGQTLGELCKPGVKINNRASGGRSTKSFIDEKRWDKVLAGLSQGDYLIIQFGHNDQKKDKPRVYAPADSLYPELLNKYIAEARAKGAHPVLVSPVCRRIIRDGKIKNSLGAYPAAMKAVALQTDTAFIDLNAISLEKFNELGPEKTKDIFLHVPPGKYAQYPKGKADNSHFQEDGARQIAGWVVEDAKRQNLPIVELFK